MSVRGIWLHLYVVYVAETLWHISSMNDDDKAKATYLDLKGNGRMEMEVTRGFVVAYLYIYKCIYI